MSDTAKRRDWNKKYKATRHKVFVIHLTECLLYTSQSVIHATECLSHGEIMLGGFSDR